MRTLIIAATLLAGLATTTLAADIAAGPIRIHEPWARASLGAAPNSAAYMRLETVAEASDRLVGVSTPAAEAVQLHTHMMEDGVAKMRPVEAIEVAPGRPTVLEPGGLHLMLVGLTGPLAAGSTLSLTLTFEQAGEVTLEVPVMGMGTPMEHGEHGSAE